MVETAEFWEHWYETIESEDLRQGDVIPRVVPFWLPPDLPVLTSLDEVSDSLEILAQYGSPSARIIISASCDLDARSFPHVLLAPVYEVSEATLKSQGTKDFRRRAEALRSGLLPRQFSLAEYPPLVFPRSFVSWHDIVMLPRPYLLASAPGPRMRLRHPYREQFGNWVGRRMSEVGPETETQIPRDNLRPQPHHLVDTVASLDETGEE